MVDIEPQALLAHEALKKTPPSTEGIGLKNTIDQKGRESSLQSTAKTSELLSADVRLEIAKITPDVAVQDSVVRLAMLVNGETFPASMNRGKFMDEVAEDLRNLDIFRTLQTIRPLEFGAPGTPLDKLQIEEFIKNPNFKRVVHSKINGILRGEKIDKGEIAALDAEIITLTKNAAEKQKTYDDNEKKIIDVQKELSKYDEKLEMKKTPPVLIKAPYAQLISDCEVKNKIITTQLPSYEKFETEYKKILVGKPSGTFAEVTNPLDGKKYTTFLALEDDVKNGTIGIFDSEINRMRVELKTNEDMKNHLVKKKETLEKQLEESKTAKPKLKEDDDIAAKKLADKEKEKVDKEKVIEQKNKDLEKSIKDVLGESYAEMYTNIHQEAGKYLGEKITKAEQLMEKRLDELLRSDCVEEKNGKCKIKKEVEVYFQNMKAAKPGEAVQNFGRDRLQQLYSDPSTSSEVKKVLDSIAKFVPTHAGGSDYVIETVNGKLNILNEEKFNGISTKLTGELLAIQVAKDPGKLKDIFSKDEVLARIVAGDVLPKMMEQAIKEKKFAKGLPGFENITDSRWSDLGKWAMENKKTFGLLLILLIGGGIMAFGKLSK